VSKELREVISDWLMVLAAILLFVSLFVTWSHQFSPAFWTRYGNTPALQGVPRDPTAWQVYSIADVLLAGLAVLLFAVALRGWRGGRIAALLGVAVALAFTVHALGTPPTNGANLFGTSLNIPDHPTPGAGEVIALVGLGLGLVGVTLSFTAT
jgi:hypothetical protein